MRRQVTLGVAGWCAVVALVAFVVWQAIDAAGGDLFGAGAQTTDQLLTDTPTPSAPSSPGTSPSRSATAPSGPQTRSWQGAAGMVTAGCTSGRITLQSATPANGYAVNIDKPGPEEVRVELVRGDQEVRVEARCAGGVPTFEADDRNDSSGSSGRGSGSDDD